MDLKELVDKITELSALNATLGVAGSTHTAEIARLTAENANLTTQLTAATATATTDQTTSAARIAELETGNAAVVTFLKGIATRTRTALGKDVADLPEDAAALMASITEDQASLTAMIPLGGRSNGAEHNGKTHSAPALAAFVTQ